MEGIFVLCLGIFWGMIFFFFILHKRLDEIEKRLKELDKSN